MATAKILKKRNKETSLPHLWKLYPDIWPTKPAFFTWLRGCLRRGVWEKYPIKLAFKNEVCSPPPAGLKTKAKSGQYCALSGEWVGKSSAEVDHIKGNVSLKGWDDLVPFIGHLCATKDQLQYVSKDAHKIKSYAERMGISFEEARAEKKAISFLKKPKEEVLAFLEDCGYNGGVVSNASKRREALVKIFLKEAKNG